MREDGPRVLLAPEAVAVVCKETRAMSIIPQLMWDFTFKSKNCEVCAKTFPIPAPSRYDLQRYCSRACCKIAFSGRFSGQNNPNYKHGSVSQCLVCGADFRNRIPNRRKYCSLRCARSLRRGDKAPAWKGGVTPLSILLRQTEEYKSWRKAVYTRDKFACQLCGCSKGGSFHAHHILKFSDYPEWRTEIRNGITLCRHCHEGKVNGHEKDFAERFLQVTGWDGKPGVL